MGNSNLFSLDSKVAAVIGAGSGIGEAVALGAARQGASVVCLDIDDGAAERVAARIGEGAIAATVDIRDNRATADALGLIVRLRGRLDIVICTPAVNVRKPVLRFEEADFDRVVALNLKGTFNVLQAAGRIMTGRKAGSIVLFSSIRGRMIEPGQSVYAMTKAGIVQLVRTAAAEFGPSGVRVNAVAPGVVETPLTAPIKSNPEWYNAYADKTVFRRWAHADEMVGPTLFLASDAASYVTGTILYADGGWTAADGRFTPPGM
jgi:NAD(P)-dependent dehydrogenase (short-subunit alcohol dehydrogenase family)